MPAHVVDQSSRYKGARPLRTFEHLGEKFSVVRWRDERGKHWRNYCALLHDGACVSTDITRNATDAQETYESMLARRFRDRATLIAALTSLKTRRTPCARKK